MIGMRGWILAGGLLAAIGVVKLLVSRAVGRGRPDVGAVSEGWLAQQRADTFDPSR